MAAKRKRAGTAKAKAKAKAQRAWKADPFLIDDGSFFNAPVMAAKALKAELDEYIAACHGKRPGGLRGLEHVQELLDAHGRHMRKVGDNGDPA